LMTCSSSTVVSLSTISSTLLVSRRQMAAITASDTLSAAPQRRTRHLVHAVGIGHGRNIFCRLAIGTHQGTPPAPSLRDESLGPEIFVGVFVPSPLRAAANRPPSRAFSLSIYCLSWPCRQSHERPSPQSKTQRRADDVTDKRLRSRQRQR
jgi:hypothetical protein